MRVLEARLPALEDAVQAAFVTPDSPRTLFGPEPVNLDSPEQVQAALARVGVHVRVDALGRAARPPRRAGGGTRCCPTARSRR